MDIQTQAVGVDIAAKDFTVCLCKKSLSGDLDFSAAASSFSQTKTGFNQLLRWAKRHSQPDIELVYVMEATGVYYEKLAHHLHGAGKTVHVLLPNKVKYYFQSLNVKTKTDRIDARIISRLGTERKLQPWQPPSPVFAELRNLTRYLLQLKEQKTTLNNIHHSKESAYQVQKFILRSNKQLVRQIDKQIEQCRKEIDLVIEKDPDLAERVDQLCTIPGVGRVTVATVVAETRGFQRFENIKQLTSYAGYDVVQRESGTSIKGKTRISKKGNRYIRSALFFPALVATRYNPDLRGTYLRIIQNKPSKMVGVVAIQRKLLILLYTMWKNKADYQVEHKKIAPTTRAEATQDSSAAA